MAESEEDHSTKRMIVAIVGVLGGAALAALIFWWGLRSARSLTQPIGQAPELSARVQQIRSLIRAANQGDVGAAASASSLLDDLESTYGAEALSRACNPGKLRGLIAKVQNRRLSA